MTSSVRVTHCRSCATPTAMPFLNLGDMPVANALCLDADASMAAPRHPLGVLFCPACTLVQLTHELPADKIFGLDYPYLSSVSDELREHSHSHARELVRQLDLGPNSLVVEIGSNDGYLLREFLAAGVQVLGIEPTPGPAAAARRAGVPVLQEFFTPTIAARLRAEGLRPQVIIANNVMAHVPDLNGFVAAIATLVTADTLVHIENPYVRDLIDKVEFDTIYHEHYCYFSCTAVSELASRHGLTLNAAHEFPVHGGSLRWALSRNPHIEPSARRLIAAEARSGLDRPAYYQGFATSVHKAQRALLGLLQELHAGGASIAAYGAAAKGVTLLNSTGVPAGLLSFVVDRNESKQGKYLPGVALPVLAPRALHEHRPDYVLLLTWNFRREILRQQSDYRALGGRFIIPVPELEVV